MTDEAMKPLGPRLEPQRAMVGQVDGARRLSSQEAQKVQEPL
jgi:hypothetical protein